MHSFHIFRHFVRRPAAAALRLNVRGGVGQWNSIQHLPLLSAAPARPLFSFLGFKKKGTSPQAAGSHETAPASFMQAMPFAGSKIEAQPLVAVSWGDNTFGQCGNGKCQRDNAPEPLAFPESQRHLFSIVRLACGLSHAVAIVNKTVVSKASPSSSQPAVPMMEKRQFMYTWGSNFNGQLGTDDQSSGLFDDDEDDFPLPRILTNSSVRKELVDEAQALKLADGQRLRAEDAVFFVDCAAGFFHTMSLSRLGRVLSWGAGILGHGDSINDGALKILKSLSGIRAIAAGGFQSLAAAEKEVFFWGWLRAPLNHASPTYLTNGFLKVVGPVSIPALRGRHVEHISCGFSHFSVATSSPGDAQSTNQIEIVSFGLIAPAPFQAPPDSPMFSDTRGIQQSGDAFVYETSEKAYRQEPAPADYSALLLDLLQPSWSVVIQTPAQLAQLAAGNGVTAILLSSGQMLAFGESLSPKMELHELCPLPDGLLPRHLGCGADFVCATADNGAVFQAPLDKTLLMSPAYLLSNPWKLAFESSGSFGAVSCGHSFAVAY